MEVVLLLAVVAAFLVGKYGWDKCYDKIASVLSEGRTDETKEEEKGE
jgi:hypothetical protein